MVVTDFTELISDAESGQISGRMISCHPSLFAEPRGWNSDSTCMSWRRVARSNPKPSWAWCPTCCMKGGEYTELPKAWILICLLFLPVCLNNELKRSLQWCSVFILAQQSIGPRTPGVWARSSQYFNANVAMLDTSSCLILSLGLGLTTSSLWSPD